MRFCWAFRGGKIGFLLNFVRNQIGTGAENFLQKRAMKTRITPFFPCIFFAVCLALTLLCGCGGGERQRFEQRFQALNDSVLAQAPGVQEMLRAEMAKCTDSTDYCCWLYQLLRCYTYAANFDSIEALSNEIIARAAHVEHTPRLCRALCEAYNGKVNTLMVSGNHDSLAHYLRLACETVLQSDMRNYAPQSYARGAALMLEHGKIAEAALWLNRALFLADSLQVSPKEKNGVHILAAPVYATIDDSVVAQKYFNLGYQMLDSQAVDRQLLHNLNYAAFLVKYHQYAPALQPLRAADSILKARQIENVYRNVADATYIEAYLHLDSLEQAKRLMPATEEAFRSMGAAPNIYQCKTNRLLLAVKENRLADATKILAEPDEEVSPIATEWASRQEAVLAYNQARGDYRAAFATLQDMRANEQAKQRTTAMAQDEMVMQKFHADSLAFHRHQAEEQHAKEMNRARIIGIAVSALAIILALLLALQALLHRKKRLQNELEKLKLRLANNRNRISPHFIFNVLNNEMAKADPQEKEQMMRVVKLIRANLDNTQRTTISLREELAFVDNYVDVERPLLGPDFSYEKDIPDTQLLDTVQVPSMFIQILVENAIKHGLRAKDGDKRLRIALIDLGDQVEVKVMDNGSGFNAKAAAATPNGKVGLGIIRNSISIFNEQAPEDQHLHLNIQNQHDSDNRTCGCTATLTLPKKLQTPDILQ